MRLERFIQIISGKKEFRLSPDIPYDYIILKGLIFFLGLLRGLYRSLRMQRAGRKLFIGKKVSLLNKKSIIIGDNVRISNYVVIDALSKKGVMLGDRVKIGDSSKIFCTGTLSDLGQGIKIGNDSSFAENTFFGAAGGIEIGDDVISGQNVRFHAENHNYNNVTQLIRLQGVNRQGIKIGNNVWIGSGVTFLDGCKIGDNCVVAAGAVVSGEFDNNNVIGGIPAKIIKRIN